MTQAGWVAIENVVDALRKLAHAPREDWLRHIHRVEEQVVARPGSVVPLDVQTTAAAAKHLVRLMRFAHENSEIDLRGIALAMANVITIEIVARTEDADRPYWMRADR